MQEYIRCENVGYSNQMIAFGKTGQDPLTGKITLRLLDENGYEHKYKFVQDSIQENFGNMKRRHIEI